MEQKNAGYIKFITGAVAILWAISAVFAFGASSAYSTGREKIQYRIVTRKNPYVQKGWKIWLKEGKYGYKNAVMENISVFGRSALSRPYYETELIKKPESAFLVVGASRGANPIIVPKECFAHYAYDMEATAYDPSPESNSLEWAGETALGWRTRYGIAAVDPRVIALRSLIFVEGYGFAWAGDTGGDIKGKRIDLCYNTTKEALRWGRRKARVYVLSGKSWQFFRDKKIMASANEKK